MFDIGWGELLLIGAVALVVIGPKDLPRALRTLGQMTAKMRRMAGEFQSQFNEAIREAEMEDIRRNVTDLKETAQGFQRDLQQNFNPIQTIRDEIKGAIDGAKPKASEPEAEGSARPPEALTAPDDAGSAAAVPLPDLPPVPDLPPAAETLAAGVTSEDGLGAPAVDPDAAKPKRKRTRAAAAPRDAATDEAVAAQSSDDTAKVRAVRRKTAVNGTGETEEGAAPRKPRARRAAAIAPAENLSQSTDGTPIAEDGETR